MSELFAIKDVYSLYENNQLLVMIGMMAVVFYPLLMVIRKLLLPIVAKAVSKRNTDYSQIFLKHHLSRRIVWVFISLYFMFWGSLLDKSDLATPAIIRIKEVVLYVFVITTISSLLLSLMDIVVDISQRKDKAAKFAIDLHMHILKIVVWVCAILSIISLFLGISISSLFTSLGAAAALLTFVFKDIVIGLIASLQITLQGIIRVGDWITLPQYNADGAIKKITITVVVIRNFDGTYTTVPTSVFLTTGIKNWRHMFEGGGRRIKRSISLDMETIKICNQKTLDSFKKIPVMADFVKNNPSFFDKKSEKTNVSMFRYYIEQYLKSHQQIHQDGFAFLVRELNPTPTGLPIELYVFTKDTKWTNYEAIQADIFDHLLGIMPQFGLKTFQAY